MLSEVLLGEGVITKAWMMPPNLAGPDAAHTEPVRALARLMFEM